MYWTYCRAPGILRHFWANFCGTFGQFLRQLLRHFGNFCGISAALCWFLIGLEVGIPGNPWEFPKLLKKNRKIGGTKNDFFLQNLKSSKKSEKLRKKKVTKSFPLTFAAVYWPLPQYSWSPVTVSFSTLSYTSLKGFYYLYVVGENTSRVAFPLTWFIGLRNVV